MKSEFGVEYHSAAHNASLMFTSLGRTLTQRELDDLVAKHEPTLASRLPGHREIIELGRLPPTEEPTLPPTIVAGKKPRE